MFVSLLLVLFIQFFTTIIKTVINVMDSLFVGYLLQFVKILRYVDEKFYELVKQKTFQKCAINKEVLGKVVEFFDKLEKV